jgi:hypothetical protein
MVEHPATTMLTMTAYAIVLAFLIIMDPSLFGAATECGVAVRTGG